MAKNNKKKESKEFKNPAKTVWGKVIITTLAILMAASGLITLIYFIIQGVNNV
jgi:hypothetical protein